MSEQYTWETHQARPLTKALDVEHRQVIVGGEILYALTLEELARIEDMLYDPKYGDSYHLDEYGDWVYDDNGV